ncbi:MAG TPA: twin-arginine translocase TatA/TatE family subunit [Chloroflexota bacterium]|nr:twin-arginine translocase TatA/TatE family subunit [Chloroflexota bacterium]
MGFMGLGPGELFLILVLAVLVFGPAKLPEIGNSLGKGIREFRKATNEVMEPVNEVKKSVNEIKELPNSLLTGTPAGGGTRADAAQPARPAAAEAPVHPTTAESSTPAAEPPAKTDEA